MTDPRQAHRAATRVFSCAMMVIGVALFVQALVSASALSPRLLLGVLFIAAGGGRLYVQLRRQQHEQRDGRR